MKREYNAPEMQLISTQCDDFCATTASGNISVDIKDNNENGNSGFGGNNFGIKDDLD